MYTNWPLKSATVLVWAQKTHGSLSNIKTSTLVSPLFGEIHKNEMAIARAVGIVRSHVKHQNDRELVDRDGDCLGLVGGGPGGTIWSSISQNPSIIIFWGGKHR